MIYIQIVGLTKSQKITKIILITKIFVAVFTTFFLFLMIYVSFFEQKSSLWMLLMILWMFLFAAYEFITSQKPEEIDLSIEIDEIGQTKN
jgi:fatty acid desaturase